jgi:hypothetical protein
MPEPAEQFAIDPQAAALALLLAEAAARNVLDLRDDRPAGDLHIALFSGSSGGAPLPEAQDAAAVIDHMQGRLIADHGVGATNAVIAAVGFSKKDITRLKAFECLLTGIDSYEAILARRKFDGATRSYGSRLFAQAGPAGASTRLISAASGWRADQDYLAAMIVAATLQNVLLEYGALPREQIVSEDFLLCADSWEYPAA